MIKLLILVCSTWALASCQGQSFDYFYDYVDSPQALELAQPVARPPPPPIFQSQTRAPSRATSPPRSRAPAPRPAVQQISRGEGLRSDGPTTPKTPPVEILRDSRRIDTKTGAFVYEYAGADGSEKYEWRFSNGTVIGNYTFINDLGERETRVYSAGVFDPNHVDETTDPNYVDLGNYELYKHLEEPYVHNDGLSGFQLDSPRSQQAARPRSQPRPAPRQQPAPRRPPPPQQFQAQAAPAPVPQDFNQNSARFEQAPSAGPVFDYEDIAVAPAPARPPPPPRGSSSRGRAGGRPRAPAPQERPSHRLDFSDQSSDSILDSFISRFQ